MCSQPKTLGNTGTAVAKDGYVVGVLGRREVVRVREQMAPAAAALRMTFE